MLYSARFTAIAKIMPKKIYNNINYSYGGNYFPKLKLY